VVQVGFTSWDKAYGGKEGMQGEKERQKQEREIRKKKGRQGRVRGEIDNAVEKEPENRMEGRFGHLASAATRS